MKVLKFGGTSVGSVASLRNVKEIVTSNGDESIIVVVSALGGVTDRLIAMARKAVAGDDSYESDFAEVSRRHYEIIDELIAPDSKEEIKARTEELLSQLANVYKGLSLLRDLSTTTLDLVVSYGERLSSGIIAGIILPDALLDSREFIKTTQRWNKNVFSKSLSEPEILESFRPLLAKRGARILVPGFIASDAENSRITNLGRGGSDYTAAILAATLHASVLEIWTDVDGFMTADPRVIPHAYAIPTLTFTEAMELCNFGAKVIYPPTIYPVFLADIPILIKNTFNPGAPGTLISSSEECAQGDNSRLIKGVSSINDTSLVSISGLGMVGIPGINARIFGALAKRGISVFMVSQASSENSTSLAVRDVDAAMARQLLEEEFTPELSNGSISEVKVTSGLSTVAIVGAQMRQMPGVAGLLFNTLGRNGISMIACAQGANQTNISFVVESNNLRKALHVIHDSFFLSQTQVLNLFIVGTGKVGSSLLDQIDRQQKQLLTNKSLDVKVVGIANSRKACFNREGIDLKDYRRLLDEEGEKLSPDAITETITEMNIFNPVFVDCTSNPEVAAQYERLLSNNVNVVAANKFGASGPIDYYHRLKNVAQRRDVKFLFETNVGAGLPIISTLNSLINSGDKILKIEAVLSGTLNYIFNTISSDISLTEAIKGAQRLGYSEADPRADLSGDDVVRKIVILVRESGYEIEQTDVNRKPFLPGKCFCGNVDEFFAEVKEFEVEFEKMRKAIDGKNGRFRYVARFEEGKATASLEEVFPGNPFFNIEDSNNIIALTTERYREYPIIIKGYGAGAEVTAAGVFADIISIANIR